jgi:hypothetical protein
MAECDDVTGCGSGDDWAEVAWVPGVPYVEGWEAADAAGAALSAALERAGVVGVVVRGDAAPTGAGRVMICAPVSAVEVLLRWAQGAAADRSG